MEFAVLVGPHTSLLPLFVAIPAKIPGEALIAVHPHHAVEFTTRPLAVVGVIVPGERVDPEV